MKRSKITTYSAILVLALSIVACVSTAKSQSGLKRSHEQPQTFTREQISAIVLAIEDEIYDYSQQKAFFDVGVPTETTAGRVTKIFLYISPHLTSDGMGEAIYKNMPYGEIIRAFHIDASGAIVLAGGPQIGFPVTQPSHLTVFMDDDELCEDKAHWLRSELLIRDNPSKEFIAQAANRQLKRVGFSHFLDTHRQLKSR